MRFRYNPNCSCSRCRAHGYMGPAVLITIGVLFLFDQMGHMHWMGFDYTWPALLIVIGLIKLLEHGASSYGHIPREYGSGPPAWQQNQTGGAPPYPYTAQPGAPGATYPAQPAAVTPPPPVPPAGFITPGTSIKGPDDRGGA